MEKSQRLATESDFVNPHRARTARCLRETRNLSRKQKELYEVHIFVYMYAASCLVLYPVHCDCSLVEVVVPLNLESKQRQ